MASKRMAKRGKKDNTIDGELRIFEQLLASPAQVTGDDVDRVERNLTVGAGGVNRRAGLLLLTKSGRELVALAKDRSNAVMLAAGAEAAAKAAEQLRAIADSLESAKWRALLAITEREDMQAVIAEGKQGFETPARR